MMTTTLVVAILYAVAPHVASFGKTLVGLISIFSFVFYTREVRV
jgi:hypothetical protein